MSSGTQDEDESPLTIKVKKSISHRGSILLEQDGSLIAIEKEQLVGLIHALEKRLDCTITKEGNVRKDVDTNEQ